MKTLLILFTVASVLCAAPASVNAEVGHDHDRVGGPKGGRLLENTEPRAEFFVEKDKTITITFYDDALKQVAAADQNIAVIVETGEGKTKLDFEKKDDVLVSKGKLPDGNSHKLVVQFKQTADAKPNNFRFTVDDQTCGLCKRAEYACICEH